jgi:deoxyribodipyrimidine photolyase-related protein
VRVAYTRLDDPANTHSLAGEVARTAARLRPAAIVATEPGEWRVLQDMRGWQQAAGVPVELRDDTRFICRLQEFRVWARGKRGLRMEFFYREMRRRTGLLELRCGEPQASAGGTEAAAGAAVCARCDHPRGAGGRRRAVLRSFREAG